MGKCIIIAPLYAGEHQAYLQPEDGDLLICADGGYDAAVKHGFKPDLVIGDFDSMPADHVQGCACITLPVHKDDTDMVLAVKCGGDIHEIHPASHCLRTSSWVVNSEKILYLQDNVAVTEIDAAKGTGKK